MFAFVVFTIEVGLSVAISYSVIRLLMPQLRNVLVEACGTGQRADFWGMFSQLMLFIAPLLIVILFTDAASADPNAVLAIKNALFRALLGQFIALAAIGYVIWETIKRDHDAKSFQPSAAGA